MAVQNHNNGPIKISSAKEMAIIEASEEHPLYKLIFQVRNIFIRKAELEKTLALQVAELEKNVKGVPKRIGIKIKGSA